MTSIWLVTSLVIFVASFMQGAAGFAFALLAVPFLVWTGFSLAEASIITAINAIVIVSLAAHKFRKHLDWSFLWPTIVLRVFSISLGIFFLNHLNNLDRHFIRQILGLLLLIIVIIQFTVKPKARDALAPIWWWLAFGLAGFLMGLVGFGGPPSVLWVMAHNWPNLKSRALLTGIYWTGLPIQILLLLGSFGSELYQSSVLALSFIPIALLGILCGLWWGDKLNKDHLKYAAYSLLSFAALSSFLSH